jgi:hypothetical protein
MIFDFEKKFRVLATADQSPPKSAREAEAVFVGGFHGAYAISASISAWVRAICGAT